MKYGMKLASALVAATVMLSGCATIIKGSRQEVNFASTPSEAEFTILDNKTGQAVHTGVTPQIVTLKRKKSYTVRFEKSGFKTREIPISKGVNGWIFGNVVFGGLIGIIIDSANGSVFALKDVNAALQEDAVAMQIRSIDSLTEEEKARLIKIS